MSAQKIKREIIETTVNLLNFQLEDILSICESEIEKIMLLNFYKYCLTAKEHPFDMEKFYNLHFIADDIHFGDLSVEIGFEASNEIKYFRDRVRRLKYRREGDFYRKFIGLGVSACFGESTALTEIQSPSVFKSFEIIPQYEEEIDGKSYRIDIAIVLKRESEGKVIECRKIALECDGYDYHSSPVQKMHDDKRSRKLKKSGWKEVFRYSGKEILELSKSGGMEEIYNEIVALLYL